MRTSMRRFTHLTNGFSKKIENHAAVGQFLPRASDNPRGASNGRWPFGSCLEPRRITGIIGNRGPLRSWYENYFATCSCRVGCLRSNLGFRRQRSSKNCSLAFHSPRRSYGPWCTVGTVPLQQYPQRSQMRLFGVWYGWEYALLFVEFARDYQTDRLPIR
jgi:hypothetical protein